MTLNSVRTVVDEEATQATLLYAIRHMSRGECGFSLASARPTTQFEHERHTDETQQFYAST